ncbi:MAG: SDR family NAD(P)-dependent oxidoreductase [Acidibrevibacterium sp.]|uniref:SDR family NAD(P)-dependent oxidoreductase n=1 Tax=Acidibrevibacterium sp. TaxID=2606776 RepID=UPI003D038424
MGKLNGLAVITGGASGIGAACARTLHQRGAEVVVLDCDIARADRVAAELGGHAVAGDVGDADAIERVVEAIEQIHGPVEILVNSAGIIQRPVSPKVLPMAVWDEVVRIDQRGTYVTCVAFGSRMAQRRRGVIVNIASIAGMRSMPLHAYAPAKAAVISLTQNLAAEWGRAGVRVNCVSPGYTRTPALQAAIDRGERDISSLTALSALGRMVEPEDIGRAVAFLCSAEASAITGVNLPVDCGWLVAPSWLTYGGLPTPGDGATA